jgi:heat shock protein HslJ
MFQRFAPLVVGSLAFASFAGFAMQSTLPAARAESIPAVQSVKLEGVTWQLSEWRVNDKNISLLPKNPITIRFDGKRLGGSTGCNSYGADYQLRKLSLQVGDIVSTMIGCAPDVAERESRFGAALKSSRPRIRVAQNRLTIQYENASGKGVMVFTPVQSRLPNTSWQLNAIRTGSKTTVTPRRSPITLKFTANSVGGFSGCNQYNAAYQEPNNQLTIGAIASTKKGCAAPQMQLEQSFLSKLGTVQRYQINRIGNLELFFQQGNQSGILVFTQQTR